MGINVYINLPVADLTRSREFFEALGFSFNDQFSDDTGLAMVISETCSAMLLTHNKFKEFTPKAIVDARTSSEVLNALQVESRQEVDRIADLALAHGGSAARVPKDHGFMYERAFQDPDGHIWELFYMDETQLPKGSDNS